MKKFTQEIIDAIKEKLTNLTYSEVREYGDYDVAVWDVVCTVYESVTGEEFEDSACLRLYKNQFFVEIYDGKELLEINLTPNLFCEECKNCVGCLLCKNCTDCRDCTECSECSDCLKCEDCVVCSCCYGCSNCKGCAHCEDCLKCEDCRECSDCRNCSDCRECIKKNYR